MTAFFILVILFLIMAVPTPVHAVCPACTVAVAAGLGISRWLGIDDVITGVWIGALTVSSGLWLADWIRKNGWPLPFKKVVSILSFYLFIIPPLYWLKMIGIANNILWGVDKLILGIIIGSMVFLFGVVVDEWLRTTNENSVYIYYQKVIIPIFLLAITSFIFYLITN